MVSTVRVGFRGWILYIRSALKGWKLEKAHPNIYEAVTLFQSEQATTEVSIMQLAAGGLPVHRRKKYRNYEKRLVTIREYEAGDYSLSELVKACSHWVSL